MDVRAITGQDLAALAEQQANSRFLLVAGWPCEDLSTAGLGKGLAGDRSSAFFDTVRVLGGLQQLLNHAPAYLLENTSCSGGTLLTESSSLTFPTSPRSWGQASLVMLHASARAPIACVCSGAICKLQIT